MECKLGTSFITLFTIGVVKNYSRAWTNENIHYFRIECNVNKYYVLRSSVGIPASSSWSSQFPDCFPVYKSDLLVGNNILATDDSTLLISDRIEGNAYELESKWYGDKVIIPNALNGISHVNISSNVISPKNKLSNCNIDIYSSVGLFTNNCNGENVVLSYDIKWFVNIVKPNENGIIDENKLNLLRNYLLLQANYDSTCIDLSNSKRSKVFIINFKCDNALYDCDVNVTHSIDIKYSNNICNGISFNDLSKYKMSLNGELFIFVHASQNDLSFNWKCIGNANNNQSCNELFSELDKSRLTVDFSKILLNTTRSRYTYKFALEVYEKTHMYRDICSDCIQLNDMLIIQTQSHGYSYELQYDKVIITADIINDFNTVYESCWFETNRLVNEQ